MAEPIYIIESARTIEYDNGDEVIWTVDDDWGYFTDKEKAESQVASLNAELNERSRAWQQKRFDDEYESAMKRYAENKVLYEAGLRDSKLREPERKIAEAGNEQHYRLGTIQPAQER